LLETNPAPWTGAMMLSPVRFPDLSVMPPENVKPKILISNGGAERNEKAVQAFQEAAVKSGVMVDVVTHPGAVHRLQGDSGLRERTRAMVDFVFAE
jgi:acetyl esterase/lipase